MGITSGKILNASGLPNEVLKDNRYPGSALEEENTLSAQDVAVVTMHLLEDFPEILEITKQTEVNFAGNSIKSFNQLLPGMAKGRAGVDGLKTGTTDLAGHCLVVTSIENGMRVITVILNADGSDKTKTRDLSKQIVCWTMWIELIVVVRFLKRKSCLGAIAPYSRWPSKRTTGICCRRCNHHFATG